MMTMRNALVGLLLGNAVWSGLSIDIEISSIDCRQDLYISVGYMELECNGSSRCTFGSYADVNGYLTYQNDLDNSGLYEAQGGDGQYTYLSGQLNTWTVRYDLMDFYQLPLCWEYEEQAEDAEGEDQGQEEEAQEGDEAAEEGGGEDQQEAEAEGNDGGENGEEQGDGNNNRRRRLQDNNNNECPGNGEYPFSVRYKLPNADNPAVSWMATGWTGTSEFFLYAKSEEEGGDSYPLGQCTITFSTHVTPSASEGFLHTPSAATTAGIVLASIFAAGLLGMYCYCCTKSKKRKFEPAKEGDDITSSFRRMDTTEDGEPIQVDGKVI